jgi:hypothetical protein
MKLQWKILLCYITFCIVLRSFECMGNLHYSFSTHEKFGDLVRKQVNHESDRAVVMHLNNNCDIRLLKMMYISVFSLLKTGYEGDIVFVINEEFKFCGMIIDFIREHKFTHYYQDTVDFKCRGKRRGKWIDYSLDFFSYFDMIERYDKMVYIDVDVYFTCSIDDVFDDELNPRRLYSTPTGAGHCAAHMSDFNVGFIYINKHGERGSIMATWKEERERFETLRHAGSGPCDLAGQMFFGLLNGHGRIGCLDIRYNCKADKGLRSCLKHGDDIRMIHGSGENKLTLKASDGGYFEYLEYLKASADDEILAFLKRYMKSLNFRPSYYIDAKPRVPKLTFDG